MASKKPDEGTRKAVAALSYILVGLIWYLVDSSLHKDEFVKFHVKQGLNLLIVGFVLNTILMMLIITIFLVPILQLVILIFIVLGIINAVGLKSKELPVIGSFADKYLKF